jgi:hypothetical protein
MLTSLKAQVLQRLSVKLIQSVTLDQRRFDPGLEMSCIEDRLMQGVVEEFALDLNGAHRDVHQPGKHHVIRIVLNRVLDCLFELSEELQFFRRLLAF